MRWDFLKKQARRTKQPKVLQRKNIAFRMNLLFFSIFVLFSTLILRLGYLQIVKSEDYIGQLERMEEISVNTSVPRGRIFDRDGRILVDNEPENAITYTKMSSTTTKDMLKVAEKLAGLIDQDTKRTNIGDKKDFWILKNSELAAEKISKKELKKVLSDTKLTDSEKQRKINRMTRDRITEDELDTFTEEDLQILAIYREMMSGYAFSPQIIKSENVTDEEFATVSERLSELPGVNTTTDWVRVKKSPNTILGSTTNPSEGIPASNLNYYLARDYSRNDRVGKSFLEQQYEELLQGQKSIVKNVKDRTGEVVETVTVQEGEPGKDLVLTIDSELNEALEEIVSEKLLKVKAGPNSQALDKAFLVMMNPQNGEILSLVGKQVVKSEETGRNEIIDYTFGTYTAGYRPGSSIKMATLLTGYQEGGAYLGETKIDEMIDIAGKQRASLFNRSFNQIPVNDIMAIGRSSNVYMYKIAMGIGGTTYKRGGNLKFNKDSTMAIMANSFESFGLGSKTGIDLPGEAIGYTSNPEYPGLVLDYAIGQFATYTPIQLAQFVSTIANDGYRIAPKLLKEIHEPSPDGVTFGSLIEEAEIEVINRIKNTDEEIARVKQGMNYTYYGDKGTARDLFKGKDYDAAGKTGTAEDYVVVDGTSYSTINLSHVGFAPYENPEIAYAVLIPHVSTDQRKYESVQNEIVADAVDKYFELKEKNAKENNSEEIQKIKQPLKNKEVDKK